MALSAVTVEVVRLYQPISLHGTDGAGDEDGDEVMQAAVMSPPDGVGRSDSGRFGEGGG